MIKATHQLSDDSEAGRRSYGNKPASGGEGKPNGVFTCKTLKDRDSSCTCTWIWSIPHDAFLLKYRQTSCPAVSFHRSIGG